MVHENWGALVDISRERRRLRFQSHHDEAMTMALQKMIEATNQLKDSSFHRRQLFLLISFIVITLFSRSAVNETLSPGFTTLNIRAS